MEIDGHAGTVACESLGDCISGIIENGSRKVVLDCSDLDYISSIGLATLIGVNGQLKDLGGSLALVNVSGLVADVLRIGTALTPLRHS